jgi:hypothetical protein
MIDVTGRAIGNDPNRFRSQNINFSITMVGISLDVSADVNPPPHSLSTETNIFYTICIIFQTDSEFLLFVTELFTRQTQNDRNHFQGSDAHVFSWSSTPAIFTVP